jgi:hypothetical protein
MADVQELTSTGFNLPKDLHQLANFIGAYSVLWDVLVGPANPISVAVREHHNFWVSKAHRLDGILSSRQAGIVMAGTLRAVQIEILDYVNQRLCTAGALYPPSLAHVVQTIRRATYIFPPLPDMYYAEPKPAPGLPAAAAGAPAPAVGAAIPEAPKYRPRVARRLQCQRKDNSGFETPSDGEASAHRGPRVYLLSISLPRSLFRPMSFQEHPPQTQRERTCGGPKVGRRQLRLTHRPTAEGSPSAA